MMHESIKSGVTKNTENFKLKVQRHCTLWNASLKDVCTKIFKHWFFFWNFTSLILWVTHVKNVKKLGGHQIRFGDMMLKRSPKIWEIGLRYCIRIKCLFVQKVYKPSQNWNVFRQLLFLWIHKQNSVNYKTSSELILSFSGHISPLPTAARMPKFDAAYTEKLEIFSFPHWFFVHVFPIYRKVEENVVYRKKMGCHRPFKKVNCKRS